MKCILLIVVASCIAVSQCKLSEEMLEQVMELRAECAKRTGISVDVLSKMKDGQFEPDPSVKEFLLCFFANGGFMTDDGELEKEFIEATLIDEFGEEISNKIVAACGGILEKTPQDTAYELTKCLYVHKPSHV